jgi:hypothetical protein
MADPSAVDNASAYLSSHVVLSHPKACQAAKSHGDTFSLILDSGASMCITGDKRDFIDAIIISWARAGRAEGVLNISHVVLSHPKACQAAMSHEDTFSLIWDSCASMCITGDKRDFIDAIQPISGAKIRGIVSGLSIKGYGHVQWSVLDNHNAIVQSMFSKLSTAWIVSWELR